MRGAQLRRPKVQMPALSPGAPACTASRGSLRRSVFATGVLVVLVAFWYARPLALGVLGAAVTIYFLHLLVARLADTDRLWPFVVFLGCLAIVLWSSVPDNFDIRGELRVHAPAPVWRLFDPILQYSSGGGDTVPAPTPSSDIGVRPAIATGRAGARTRGAGPAVANAAPVLPDSRFQVGKRAGVAGVLRSGRHAGRAGAPVVIGLTGSPASAFRDPVVFAVTVRGMAPDSAAPGGRVDLLEADALIATATLQPREDHAFALFTAPSLAVGRHLLSARYRGDGAFAAGSSPVFVHTVDPAR